MSDKKGVMYRILPFNGLWSNRDVSEVVNGMMNGKINATGSIELVDSSKDNDGYWTITDERISLASVILFTARSNAQFGLPFVKKKSKGKADIGYEGALPATFDYVVLG